MPLPWVGRHNRDRALAPDEVADGNGHRPPEVISAPALSAPALAVSAPRGITLEAALYGLILVAALLTRFWDLGSRALHHDESLHAYYSWLLATGQGYVHDPLMHGPFLFHVNALIYTLIGDTDASSRFSAALFGVALVALPMLLRGERHLGRRGALTASSLLLISPALLYQSRYIRHDIFTVVGALFLFIAIVRYIERPTRGWLVAIGATLGFLLTNHEIIFGVAAIFLAIVAGALLTRAEYIFGGMTLVCGLLAILLFDRGQPLLAVGALIAGGVGLALLWRRVRPIVAVLAIAGIAALGLVALLPERTRPLPTIPWSSPTRSQQLAFYEDLLTHPLTIALALLTVVAIAAAALVMQRERSPETSGRSWATILFGDATPGSVAAAVRAAWHDHVGLSWAFFAGLAIFALLFTTLFTNLYGLASGTISTDGTLLYWLGQHDYRRGEQPWFYYLLLFPQYEFIAALFGTIATAIVGVRLLLVGIGRLVPGPRFFFQTFLAAWFCGIFLALSWAGEKMPWLVIHITLPATLLAAALLGELWERWRPLVRRGGAIVRSPGWGAPQWTLLGALVALAASWFLIAAHLTYGEFVTSTNGGGWERALTPWDRSNWWLLAVPPLLAIVAILLVAIWRGARAASQPALAALVLLLALAQVHAAWRLVYQEGDVPKDMLVYTQTSPDMKRMVDELTQLSELTTGGRDMEIWYDDNNGVSWPMQWYLRDFPNRHLYGGTLSGPPDGVPVVLAGSQNAGNVEPYLDGYTAQKYVLRWWFPEDPIYRDFAIAPEIPAGRSAWKSTSDPHGPRDIAGSVVESLSHLLTPEGQQGLYRLVMYRDLPVRIDGYEYTLYIRNDLVPLYNQIRY
jgi:predicted membrane-bound mannosyltransferase